MAKYLTVVPAYGRDYKSAKEVKKAWDEGADFLIQDVGSPDNGRYVNKAQLEGGETVNIRYKGMTQVLVVKPGKVKKADRVIAIAGDCPAVPQTDRSRTLAVVNDRNDEAELEVGLDSAIRALADLVTNKNVEKVSGMLTPKTRKLLKEKLLSYGYQGVARMIP